MKAQLLLSSLVVTAAVAIAADPPKAKLLAAPLPVKSRVAASEHLAGAGIFVLQMDTKTGLVKSIVIQKSTGKPLLDECAVEALRKWRAAPGAVPRTIVTPIIFRSHDDEARFQ
jgi:TonB family protein